MEQQGGEGVPKSRFTGPTVSTNGELTPKAKENLINLDSEYSYVGNVDPYGHLGIDVLYGNDTIPLRNAVYDALLA